IGVPDGHHSMTHHDGDPVKIEKVVKINHLHVQTFGYLLEKMHSTPDGDGSLLDHSMILYGSSLSDGNRHTHDELPLVLVGGRRGDLLRMTFPRLFHRPAREPFADVTNPSANRSGHASVRALRSRRHRPSIAGCGEAPRPRSRQRPPRIQSECKRGAA